MTAIYSVHLNGRCVGRCDAKCHNAEGEVCRCICGGAFHGVGSRIAWEDRDTLLDEELMENARRLFTDAGLSVRREPKGLFECL